ncbi:hypothetical protein DICPUDRAFT_148253 [Dictyostelium purpureum]|uniref:ADF-H domain-containing protein n=1 Tax=Dictyostelium purpureum TaxID=5786 RepID=F0ZAN0_DICPU|nr:uncharacterized protein DICPUDRAFT_148253 [Dictyostelium purpureum]EGC39026.1 hypothetical protein DICPUDRAFT_148253 [Dictyostelium purpureum]|eukprot:XP_003284479.1 hypothetical protein DICPUDRAFT_148253 [Dictyostelium purpureum]
MVKFANQAELNNALVNFRQTQTGWVLITYKTPTELEYKQSGTDIAALASLLEDNQMAYILIRLEYTPNDPGFKEGGLDNKANFKDIFISWTGPKVGILERGKKSEHRGDVQALLQPHHADISAINKANFNAATIKDRANPLSGSHVID